jgi:hypothetical protein
MKKLNLYKRAEWYLKLLKEHSPEMYAEEKDKVFTCLGEFSHAPGHHLMCEFGTWKLSGMHELDNFEKLDKHPDDFSMFISLDDTDDIE